MLPVLTQSWRKNLRRYILSIKIHRLRWSKVNALSSEWNDIGTLNAFVGKLFYLCWDLKRDSTRINRILPDFARFCQIFPDFPRFSQIFPDFPRFSQIFPDFPRFSQIFPDFPRFSQIFPDFPSFCQHVTGFNWILLDSTMY